MFEIWGSVFGCENRVVEKVFEVAQIFVILGYESILCFEFKFVNFKFQNHLINLKNKSLQII